MISLWAVVKEPDVEAYASTLVLPPYLSHLYLEPFSFRAQATNRDGHESLELSYRGEGRLEHYRLLPEDHALALVGAVCAGINTSRIHLPRDDARWHWTAGPEDEPRMRIYFAPTAQTLPEMPAAHPAEDAYVSVSRGHVFIGPPVVEAYVAAWLARLGIESEPPRCEFDTPGGGVVTDWLMANPPAFVADSIGPRPCRQRADEARAGRSVGGNVHAYIAATRHHSSRGPAACSAAEPGGVTPPGHAELN